MKYSLKHHQMDKVIILSEDHFEKQFGFWQHILQSLKDQLDNISEKKVYYVNTLLKILKIF